ncbi:nucleotidyl transferase AbiEii/AbiGii toxin family protein [Mesorhizobium sp. CN2-181]|uniref:nucleotidyl transferase AbiEii/AbiGii toxin family protein n=1 Tax=Mesorhizobium yinganensis TaxID=3157707 RepID=UPI0032B72D4B
MEPWRTLIGIAIERLEGIGLDRTQWIWGGGTVLMLRYHHRLSRDVDIFINDVQYLSYLSPRLNEAGSDNILGYSEQANHLRLEYPQGEIDFLTVAPVFPHIMPEMRRLEGVEDFVQLMPDKEILAQKLHYRAAGFTGRDLYDFAAVTQANSALLGDVDLHKIAVERRDALEVSLQSADCALGYEQVRQPTLHLSFADARAALIDWIGGFDRAPRSAV